MLALGWSSRSSKHCRPVERFRPFRRQDGGNPGKRAAGGLPQPLVGVALNQARNPERFRLLIRSEAELPEKLARVYDEGRRRVLREFISVVEEGVRAGVVRPVDARVAALGVIGLCNWVAWWHRPGRRLMSSRS